MSGVLAAEPGSISTVLDRALRLFAATLTKAAPLALVAAIAQLLLTGMYKGSKTPALFGYVRVGTASPQTMLALLVWLVAYLTSLGAVFHRIASADAGTGSYRESWSVGLRRAVPLLLCTLATMLAVGLPAGVLFGLVVVTAQMGGGVAAVVAGVAALAVTLYIASHLLLSTPEIAVNNCGVLESLRESWRMSRGHLTRIGVLFLVIAALTVMFYVPLVAVSGIVGAAFGPGSTMSLLLVNATGPAITVVLMPFHAATTLAVWSDTKHRLRGADLEARITSLDHAG